MQEKHFDELYKRTKTGAIQTWKIVVDGNSFYTIEGQLNGAKTTSKPTVCKGKNIGRANETSDEKQAILQATSKMEKKLKTGYTEDINAIDTCRTFFEAMLAKKYVDYKDKISLPTLVSRKIDGGRMVVTKDGAITRNGEKYPSCTHIENALAPLFEKYPNAVVDGEIYSIDEPFEEIMSIVRKKKPTQEDLDRSECLVKLWIFDGIIEDQKEAFNTRFESVKNAIKDNATDMKYFVFVENEIANSHQDIMDAHDRYVAEGYEGVMVRNMNAGYENKRSKTLLKYKVFNDEEFIITDVLEGEGNRSGMAGMLQIQTLSGEPKGKCGIRGGEKLYKKLLEEKSYYIGKKVTVRYQGKTKYNELRFPVAIKIDPFDR